LNDLTKEKELLQRELLKRLKKASRRVHELQIKQQESLLWSTIHHEGLLLQANLYRWKRGLRALEVSDWENEGASRFISLSPPLSGQEEVAIRFKKSRKLRLAIPHMQRELSKALKIQNDIQLLIESLDKMGDIEEIQSFHEVIFPTPKSKPKISDKKQPPLPYREYFSATGKKIWVGKKAKDNEILTFSLANGNDWWLHAQGSPGSHVVIKDCKGKDPDPETLQDALQLALVYSKAKNQGRADIIFSQQKYISRYGKGPKNCGKVQVSKHKLYQTTLDLKHFERIKKQQETHHGKRSSMYITEQNKV
jgi:predicted ribosome quality control (RQC) complex YloA/Tae2 family protein